MKGEKGLQCKAERENIYLSEHIPHIILKG